MHRAENATRLRYTSPKPCNTDHHRTEGGRNGRLGSLADEAAHEAADELIFS